MKVLLVELTPDQIEKAKAANGRRKQITHAVLCGSYGQIFGTEKHCRKYYSAWSKIFPRLFEGGEEVRGHELPSYKSTFNLVHILFEAHESLAGKTNAPFPSKKPPQKPKKKGFLARLFRG